MYRSSTSPCLFGIKDNSGTLADSPSISTDCISLERCLELYPNIPFSTKISILLEVSGELAHLHAQNPPITVGNVTKCVMLTTGLKATLVEDVTAEGYDMSHPKGSVGESTPSHDIYHFGHLILNLIGKDPLNRTDNKDQDEKESDALYNRHCLSNLAMSCLQPVPSMRPSAVKLRSTLRQLSALHGSEGNESGADSTPDVRKDAKAIDATKLTTELEEENRYLRARCQELEAENETLRKSYEQLCLTKGDKQKQKAENKDKESSWLHNFIKRSKKSEQDFPQVRKQSGTGNPAARLSVAAATVAEPTAADDSAPLRGALERRPSRPHTCLFTVGESDDQEEVGSTEQKNCLSLRPLPPLPSTNDSSSVPSGEEDDDKAQSYEIPASALCLETQQWFQVGVTVEEAQLRLKAIKIDGAYLIRESSTAKGQYTLSVYQGGRVRHIRIQNINRKQFTVDHHVIFETISDLIKYYKTHPITLKDGFESMLLHECSNRKRSR